MSRAIANIFAFILAASCVSGSAEEMRKVRSQVRPELPEMARQMKLKGTVRLEVEVAADGSVKATKPLGGHPLLIQSAEQAVRKWRFEPGAAGKTVVEFDFRAN